MSSGQGRVAPAAARYRPGKAPVIPDSSSSDDSDESQDRQRKKKESKKSQQYDQPITNLSSGTAALKNAQRLTAGIVIQQDDRNGSMRPVVKLGNVTIGGRRADAREQVEDEDDDSDEYETDTDEEAAGPSIPSKPVFRKPGAPPPKQESSEYETDSEEEEDSEEDSRPVMLKPIFVPKRLRENLQKPSEADRDKINDSESKSANIDLDVDLNMDANTKKAQILAEERRKQSHLLAAETIKRELAEKDHEDSKIDLSDTDGKDPEEEFQAWRIRELSRLKAEKESLVLKEAEREEIERRRAMPEEQRLAEDMKRAQKSRDDKKREREAAADEGGNFMQKYHHKGSFFQDMDILKNRDFSAKTESAVDMSLLPKVMQVRDYGKAGRSKWTHLSNEDTSRKQLDHRMKGISGREGGQGMSPSGQQCFTCGGPHLRRDCPQANARGGEGERAARGANNIPLRDRGYQRGERRSRSPDRRREHPTAQRRDR